MVLKPSRVSVQLLAPSGGWCRLHTHVHTVVGCAAVQLGPSSHRSPSSLHGDQSFLDNRRSLPLRSWAGQPLHHGTEGTAAVAAIPWQRLRGCGAPALSGVRGHEQGATAVG